MPDTPGSPTAARLASPGWLDTRLVLGVLLVLVSVVVGARVLSSADRSEFVWAAERDLAAGTTLTAEDLRREEVRLEPDQTARLLRAPSDVSAYVGYVTRRPLDADEFVPLNALRRAGDVDERQFALNVETGHAPPDLARGDLVDVYVTPEVEDGGPPASPGAPGQLAEGAVRRVLGNVTVESTTRDEGGLGGGGQQSAPVVLNLRPGDVPLMVAAVAEGRIDLVRVRGRRGPLQAPAPAPTATPTTGPTPAAG